MKNELRGFSRNSFLFPFTQHLLLIYFTYAFPSTIASNAILTYSPYSIWRK